MSFGQLVREPPDTSPDQSGGPIRRTVGVTTRSGEGMPPHGWPSLVLRTPHQVVRDAEPGGARLPYLEYMKFLPDGRVVPAGALGGALGADAVAIDPQVAIQRAQEAFQQGLEAAMTWGLITVGGLAALVAGFILGPAGHRLRTSVLTVAAYGGGVAATRYIAKRAASVAAALKAAPPR